ncbi:hypothetical protein D3C76_1009260 [compost metagenome]
MVSGVPILRNGSAGRRRGADAGIRTYPAVDPQQGGTAGTHVHDRTAPLFAGIIGFVPSFATSVDSRFGTRRVRHRRRDTDGRFPPGERRRGAAMGLDRTVRNRIAQRKPRGLGPHRRGIEIVHRLLG